MQSSNTSAFISSSGGGSVANPATKILYVDRTRVDLYFTTGSILYPFKTIMAAVNQVIANGDNSSSVPYLISIIGPGTYPETISLNSPKLVNLIFDGNCAAVVGTGSSLAVDCSSNPGLLGLEFNNITFMPASGDTIHLIDLTASGTFLTLNHVYFNCIIEASGTLTFTNCGAPSFYRCQITAPASGTFTGLLGGSAAFFFSTWSTGGTLTLSASNFQQLGGKLNPAIVIGVGSTLNVRGGELGIASTGPITVNGSLNSRNADIQGDITINAGGAVTQRGPRGGAVTNNGGTYTVLGFLEAATIELSNGQVILTGTGVPAVAAPVGSLYLRTDGGAGSTLYIKESGTGTSGWVAK